MGHSVTVISDESFAAPGWSSWSLRAMRRYAMPMIRKDYTDAVKREATQLQPQLFFVFKGAFVTAEAIKEVQKLGGVAVNFWPDTSIVDHGSNVVDAMSEYDWIFTTKTVGVIDIKRRVGNSKVSFLPHGYDRETHSPGKMTPSDDKFLGCDVSFIGTWSKKKTKLNRRVGDFSSRTYC